MEDGSDITIVIITYNRYPFLIRLLKFYNKYDFNFHYLVLDSSSHELDDEVIPYLERKNVVYKKYDHSIFFTDKIEDGCQFINTPYSVLCADDDFLIPAGVLASKNFLIENTDYASAHGIYFHHTSAQKANSFGFSIGPLSDKYWSTEQATGIQRVKAYLSGETSHYPLYAVHCTTTFCSIWNETSKYVSDWGLSEIFPCSLSFAYGKMKVLPIIYASREPNTFSWVNDDRIHTMYSKDKLDLAIKGIGKLVSTLDKITIHEAVDKIQTEIRKYLIRSKKKRSKSSNYIILSWNLLRKNIAVRTRIRKLFFDGCHQSIYPKYYEDYKKVKHSVVSANISDIELNISRREYSEMNKVR